MARKTPIKKMNYDIEYKKQNCKQFHVVLNKNTEADMIAYLESVDNKQAYLKALIRADMDKHS